MLVSPKISDPASKPRNPQVGVVQLDALTNLFGANCQWETSARTALDKTGCWGEQIPLHEGGGQWGANVLMCGRWLGRDNGRISQSPGWLIWDGSSQPLAVGSPIVQLLIPTSHKLQTKVNLFLKEGERISTRVSAGESDSKTYLQETTDSLTPFPLVMSFFLSSLPPCSSFVLTDQWWWWRIAGMLNDPSFKAMSGAGAPVGSLEAALWPGSLILKYTEMPSRAGLKSVWCRPWVPSLDGPLLSVPGEELSFLFSVFSFSFPPPWKDSLTNYDSWVEGLSLFTLQRQTCESRGAHDVINVSTVHSIFCLWCVKVLGFALAEKAVFSHADVPGFVDEIYTISKVPLLQWCLTK